MSRRVIIGALCLLVGGIATVIAIRKAGHRYPSVTSASSGPLRSVSVPDLVPLTPDDVTRAERIAVSDARLKPLLAGVSHSVANAVLWTQGRTKIGAVLYLSLGHAIDLPAGLPTFPATTEDQPLRVQPNGSYVTEPSKCPVVGTAVLLIYVDFRFNAAVTIADGSGLVPKIDC